MSPSTFQIFYPQSEKLKTLIKLYYVHYSEDENYVDQLTYFPNHMTTFSAYRGTTIVKEQYQRIHRSNTSEEWHFLLMHKIDRSRSIITKGSFFKITVVFYPLGLNHFLSKHIVDVGADHYASIQPFSSGINPILEMFYRIRDFQYLTTSLDDFFESAYVGLKENRIKRLIHLLLNDVNLSVERMAYLENISRKTVLRLFRQHLDMSPTAYKSILKFRRSLEAFQDENYNGKMTHLAYEGAYYDQADFNNHFKEKTGLTPKQLFAELNDIKKGLFWKMSHVPKVQYLKER